MAVQERLSLEATSADTLIAAEHVHRYRLASQLCKGLRVVDLACGSGYGSAVLRESARAVLGVDNDAATVDMARATIGAEQDIAFEAADAVEFLCRDLPADWDAIVCFEGLEHLPNPDEAIAAFARHAARGMKVLISVPNSRTFEERNEFHVTDFGYEEAVEALSAVGDVTLLYQYLAEGSLIRGETPGRVAGEFVLSDHGEREYANHFIGCINLDEELASAPDSARMHLAVSPAYNRHVVNLERANRELWRENARVGRHRLGRADAAAATTIFRIQQELREQAERAEARAAELEDRLAQAEHRASLLDTPRHQAVERARDRMRRSPVTYGVLRTLWRLTRRR
jgi:SAM-dependent methyltransferase